MASDKEIIDWLEANAQGCAVVSDDFGRWALVCDGFQTVPDDTEKPSDIQTSFFIPASEWRNSIREAIGERIDRSKTRRG